MKKFILLLASGFIFSSCQNGWDSESRELFHQGCMESAKDAQMDEAAAKSMCDCRLEKLMKKYPHFKDALEHAEEIMKDEELKQCK